MGHGDLSLLVHTITCIWFGYYSVAFSPTSFCLRMRSLVAIRLLRVGVCSFPFAPWCISPMAQLCGYAQHMFSSPTGSLTHLPSCWLRACVGLARGHCPLAYWLILASLAQPCWFDTCAGLHVAICSCHFSSSAHQLPSQQKSYGQLFRPVAK